MMKQLVQNRRTDNINGKDLVIRIIQKVMYVNGVEKNMQTEPVNVNQFLFELNENDLSALDSVPEVKKYVLKCLKVEQNRQKRIKELIASSEELFNDGFYDNELEVLIEELQQLGEKNED